MTEVEPSDAGFDSAQPDACVPAAEVCDGVDNDCDQLADENAVPETCDGNDNDCDEAIDEDWPELGDPCSAGIGECALDGFATCSPEGNATTCSAIPGEPAAEETCGDLDDDDCDGANDDGCICDTGKTQPCGLDEGVCVVGMQTCLGASWGPCEGEVAPSVESCNDADDDCDGLTDEGCPAAVSLRSPMNGHATGSALAPPTASGKRSLRPTFVWNVVAGVTHYEIEIDDSCPAMGFGGCTFPTPEVDDVAAGVAYTPAADLPVSFTAPVGRRYFWRVRACNMVGCSSWSPTRYVDVGRQPNDFNGDGYADVIIGSLDHDAPTTDEGNAFIYYGSSAGFPLAAFTTLDNPGASTDGNFGLSAGYGDINADGFGDALIGAPGQTSGAMAEGNVFVYLGGPAGLALTPSISVDSPSNQIGGFFGWAVASGGDLNGDGFADVAVGAYLFDNIEINEGATFVYLGGPAGIPTAPDITLFNPEHQNSGHFGFSVAVDGDTDGDGFADLLVGASSQDNPENDEGTAYVFAGGTGGPPIAPTATLDNPTDQAFSYFGASVALADVNQDGYGDIVVGAYSADVGAINEGNAFVFNGSPGGPAGITTLDSPTNQPNGYFGMCISGAGDVNGDGFADVAIGAPYHDAGATDEGNAFLYYGTITGAPIAPSRTLDHPPNQAGAGFGTALAGVGDVNGDGYDDIVVGATMQDNGATDEGVAYGYLGASTGIPSGASRTFDSPANQASGHFGYVAK